MMEPFQVTPEVAEALAAGRPVVALESTLVTQGLPRPANLETARAAEAAVREAGAVPATVAVFGGLIRVGLDATDLEFLAVAETFLKAGRRDLAAVVARGLDAATTVSATLWVAQRLGIGVMATGGLGGVHHDAARTFDVSTDLDALARADGMLVVCSGVKSILDMPATLEALETRGVVVAGYRTSTFPAFTTATSDLPLEWTVETPEEAAALVRAHRSLGLPGAIVVAQPVPEGMGLDPRLMETAQAAAAAEARSRGLAGKELTPFLLERVRRATEGRSLHANRALIVENARLAGRTASALSDDRAADARPPTCR